MRSRPRRPLIFNQSHVYFYYRCKGLILLETYTTREGGLLELPDFLEIDTEVTGNAKYSMFNLSLKEEMDRIKSDTSLDS